MSKIIGIDLGSTLSEVAVMEGNTPKIIENAEGNDTTPSVILLKNGEIKVGEPAKRQIATNPKNTVTLVKKIIGKTYDEVKDIKDRFPYEIRNVNGYPRIVIDDKEYTPEEISAMVLQKMKKTAEDYLGESVTEAVITVPAQFNDSQTQATMRAGKIAGLDVKRIIREPTAAILASGIDLNKEGKYMVVDYGGATLDFSVAEVSEGLVEILSSDGDTDCGGSDVDNLLIDYIIKKFEEEVSKEQNITFTLNDPMAIQRVKEAAEKAKIELSNSVTTSINIPYISAVNGSPIHLAMDINRATFENLISNEVSKVISHGRKALSDANLSSSDLTGIILVGGSTRIPLVQKELEMAFNTKIIKSAPVDQAVALGAAVQGSILKGDKTDILLVDVTPLNLGIETMHGVMTNLIEANSTIPIKKSEIFSTAVDNQTIVTIKVCQGNRPMAKDNKMIGIFNLDGIAAAPRGIPQIEVTFDIDVNGILTVSAIDKATGKKQNVTIEANSGISDEDVERMRKEAEANAAEDEKKRKEADTLNQSESIIYQAENFISENGDKINSTTLEYIKTSVENLKKAIDALNYDDMEKNSKDLMTKISLAMTEQQSSGSNSFNEAFNNAFTGQNPTTDDGFTEAKTV